MYRIDHLIVADAQIISFTVGGKTSAPAYLTGYTIAKQLMQEESEDS